MCRRRGIYRWSWYRDDIDREMWSGSRRRGRCRIGRHREGVVGEGGVDRVD